MSGSAPGRREVAYRLFAAEFDDAEFSYSESDEERAPNYVVTPTGARVNRLFAVGVLTEVEDVNPEMVRGRVVDPTGAFVTYAGQYQPDALAFLERADTPMFVALSGKARTFEPDDDDVVYSSVRPESVNEVDGDTRDRWVVTAAERTLERIGVMAAAIDADLAGDQLRAALREEGVDERLADGVALALEFYNTTPAYLGALRETALDALRVVAGERDEVGGLDVRPGDVGGAGAASATDLATLDLSGVPSPATAAAAADAGEPEPGSDESAGDIAVSDAEPEVVDGAADAEASSTADATSTGEDGDADADEEVAADAATGTAGAGNGATESEVDEPPSSTAPENDAGPTETAPSTPAEPASDTDGGDGPAVEEDEGDGEDEVGEFEPGEFDLDEETRQEVEEEYGTEFSTADEVEAADIETPEVDTEPTDATADEDAGGAAAVEGDEAGADAPGAAGDDASPSEDTSGEAAADVDLEDAVMDAMETVDEGEGVDREALVAAVVDEHGVDPAAVEDAIEDALMSGRCYEPAEGTLKAI